MKSYFLCKTDSQQEFAVWLRKLTQGLCINLEGRDGEGDGREVQNRGDIVLVLPYINMNPPQVYSCSQC